MGTKNNKKQGVASYYMVIVCALLFGVIAAGFITLMINEMGKSSENNLSQSAYDSAIVGIEDTKILIKKYYDIQDMIASIPGGSVYSPAITNKYSNADKIVDAVEGTNPGDCLNFNAIGGYTLSVDDSVFIQETTGDGITVQAYTCISLDFHPKDYLATLSSENPIRLIPLQAKDGNKNINSIRISWYSVDNLARQNTNYYNSLETDGVIQFSDDASNPPVLVASIYQAPSTGFTLDDFSNTDSSGSPATTNRGTLWLIPSEGNQPADPIYSTAYSQWGDFSSLTAPSKDRTTIINKNALSNSNKHEAGITHTGYPVRCAKDDGETANLDYLCSVQIDLPKPTSSGGASTDRSNERGTFLLALALPYSQPTTDIRVEMSNGEGNSRGNPGDAWDGSGSYDAKEFDGVQTVIDSTGRANDVYQRVESRIEFFDSDFPFPDYALTLDGSDDDGAALLKDFVTSSETYNGCWHSHVDDDKPIIDTCK